MFKEIYCSDCKMILARYSTKYFTDSNITFLVRLYFSSHIKDGHYMNMRVLDLSVEGNKNQEGLQHHPQQNLEQNYCVNDLYMQEG